MDTRTGDLYFLDSEELRRKLWEDQELRSHLVPAPEVRPGQIRAKKVGRNGPCPCGSGKKFKKCCMGRSASASERRALAEHIEAMLGRRE